MTLSRPNLELELDGTSLDGPSAAVVELRCELGLDGAHDQLLFRVAPQSPLVDVEQDVVVRVSLGNRDDLEAVFTGTVRAVERSAHGALIEAYADTWLLSNFFLAQSYVDMTVADIIGDLASQANVTTGTLEAPVTLSAFHVDESRSAWTYVTDLARFGGFDLVTTADGALSLAPASGRSGGLGALAGGALRYGAELLSWQMGPRSERAKRTGYATGAGSEAGTEKWHITLKNPGAADGCTRVLPLARDRDAASAWTDARASEAQRATFAGQALVIGAPKVRAGDTLSFELPSGDVEARCRSVVHRISAEAGFLSLLKLEGAA